MIKAEVLCTQTNSRIASERKLGEIFNAWVSAHPGVKITHFFEPVRHAQLFGDYNYNEYHVSMTFFYEDEQSEW